MIATELKLNLGSRERKLPGFKNMDIDAHPGVDLIGNGTYNSSYNVNSLLSYVRAGFTPMAQVFKGAGFDGSDIGAVSVAPPTAFFGAGP